jgi:hypothetical protein
MSSAGYSAPALGARTRARLWRLGRRVRSRRHGAWGCDRRRLDPRRRRRTRRLDPRRRRGTRRRRALRQSLRSAGPIAIFGSPFRWRNGRSARRCRRFHGRPQRGGKVGLRSAGRRNGETPRRCRRFPGWGLRGAQAGKASSMPERQLEPRVVRGRAGVHRRGRSVGPPFSGVRVVQDRLTRRERRAEHGGTGRGDRERPADGHLHSGRLARRAAGIRGTTSM